MHLLFLLYAVFANAAGESCTTPLGQMGECVPIRSCPSLLWSFANIKKNDHERLEKFVCADKSLGLMVCCRIASDYLVFENEEDDYDPNDVSNVKLVNNKNCGVASNLATNDGIVRLQDFPWLVKIIVVNGTYKHKDQVAQVGCTGVLINSRYVLYSAYCFNTILFGLDFYVTIDTYKNGTDKCNTDTYLPKCTTSEIYDADYYSVHAFSDNKTLINDIAILMLNRPVYFSEFIQPICLPTYGKFINVGEILHTVGWNRTYHLNDISVKISQTSKYISNLECQRRLRKSGSNNSVSLYEMCTHSNDRNYNNIAIGLPLMSFQDDRWYLEGFESQGKATKIYTRVQNYLHWIQEAMGGERCNMPYNNNQIGECTPLYNCSIIMDAFANSSPEAEHTLREFVCEYEDDDPDGEEYILKVCCAPNFTIPAETNNNNNNLDFQASDFRYCGLQHRDDYISTDENISVDEFPWLAVILNASLPEQRDSVCGGTLITSRYVLTSAQCSNNFDQNDTMLVRLGDYNLNNSTDCIEVQFGLSDCTDIQEYKVEEEIIHPFYNAHTFINDISLLRLNQNVGFTDYVRPICLPRSETDLPSIGATLFTTGFGDNSRDIEGPKIKKKIRTTLISNEICREKINLLRFLTPVTSYQICTEDFKNSTDVTCYGDEGGPVMYSKRSQWFIEGISSSFGCGDDEPQTHLKVFKYLKWIKLNIKD